MKSKAYCNLDWLSFSMRASDVKGELGGKIALQPFTDDEYTFVVADRGTQQFEHRGFLLSTPSKARLFTILWCPFSRVIDSRILFVEVDNCLLYENSWYEVVPVLQRLRPMTFSNLSRVDICIDYNPDGDQSNILKGLADGSLYVKGKRTSVIWFESQRTERVPFCYSFGDKSSAFKFKVYNKTKEITIVNRDGTIDYTKPYIVDCWKLSGLDVSNVWRWEVSMTSISSQSCNGISLSLDMLAQKEMYAPLAVSLYQHKFEIKEKSTNLNKSRDIKRPLLVFDTDTPKYLKYKTPDTRRNYSATTLINKWMMQLTEEGQLIDANTFDMLASTIYQCVTSAGVQGWFGARWCPISELPNFLSKFKSN